MKHLAFRTLPLRWKMTLAALTPLMFILMVVALAAAWIINAWVVDEAQQQVDFDLFGTAQAIGDGRIEPRPGDGETLLLQFWASWCHSCGTLMWDMDELVSQHEGLRYVAVSIDDDPTDARVYIRKHSLFEKYHDRYFVDAEKALSASLEVRTVPTIMVVKPWRVA